MRVPLRLLAVLLLLVTVGLAAAVAAVGDPQNGQSWHLDAIGAPQAWPAATGEGVLVAVVDTGVEHEHPGFSGQVREGPDFIDSGGIAADGHGHGTLVAGLVAAAGDGQGGIGVAPDAEILPVRVLDERGRGSSQDVAAGIRWATAEGADVINLSLTALPGGANPAGLIDREVEAAIHEAAHAGVLVIAAAGNDGRSNTPYDPTLPMLAVGAVDEDGRRWVNSNAAPHGVLAPGVDVVTTWTHGRYAAATGTSFAAPVVAGGAALLLDAGVAPSDVIPLLIASAQLDGRGGLIDIGAAVRHATGLERNDDLAAGMEEVRATATEIGGVGAPDTAEDVAGPHPEPSGQTADAAGESGESSRGWLRLLAESVLAGGVLAAVVAGAFTLRRLMATA